MADRNEAGVAIEICPASEFRDRKRLSSKRQNGCCAERDHDLRVHESQFLVQPPPVVLDLARGPRPHLLELEQDPPSKGM